jgi:uncharacterized protein (DUF2236 family)
VESLERVRAALGEAVRSRITGPDREQRAHELFDQTGPRWFDDDRPVRIVHSDASMFIGGLSALLLQTLHPLAMAGVAQHSDYRHDPWGRLQRTADFLAATTFGPATEAQRAIDRVLAVHQRVTGVADDGRPYAANDPHLLRWVHVAEVRSFLTAHIRFGGTRLTAEQRDGYVADMARIASALGVPAPPRSARGLADQLRAFRPELRATAEAHQAVKFLLWDPPLEAVARPFYGVLVAAAVSLLPTWARRQLRIVGPPVVERLTIQPAGLALTRLLAWAAPPPNRDDALDPARSTSAS